MLVSIIFQKKRSELEVPDDFGLFELKTELQEVFGIPILKQIIVHQGTPLRGLKLCRDMFNEKATIVLIENQQETIDPIPVEDKTRAQDKWMYIDNTGKVNGPFLTSQMRNWCTIGLLPSGLKVKKCAPGTPHMELYNKETFTDLDELDKHFLNDASESLIISVHRIRDQYKLPFIVEPKTTIEAIKRHLVKFRWGQYNHMRLLFCQKQLTNHETIRSANIQSSNVIHFVLDNYAFINKRRKLINQQKLQKNTPLRKTKAKKKRIKKQAPSNTSIFGQPRTTTSTTLFGTQNTNLFGQPRTTTPSPFVTQNSARQSSFGGVASLFGPPSSTNPFNSQSFGKKATNPF